jgi:hypothetical protein
VDVIKFSQKTKQEAEALLKHGNVLKILSKYGKVVLAGSYRYDLMWGPDVDLVVLSDNPEEASRNTLKDFIEQKNFQKYQLGDFIRFPRKDRPQGMIVVLIHEFKGRKWEIEIWFRKSLSEEDEDLNKLLSNTSAEQRKTILELKYQREMAGLSKHQLDSATIYKGVLTGGWGLTGMSWRLFLNRYTRKGLPHLPPCP